jgi:hypothetical protein
MIAPKVRAMIRAGLRDFFRFAAKKSKSLLRFTDFSPLLFRFL